MIISTRCGLCLCLAIALLASCSGPLPVDGPAVSTAARTARSQAVKSWMAAGANSKDLLYITGGDVFVYSYPQDQLVGELTGFSLARGDCTDAKGHVYITDSTANTVVEYAHGATQPIRTITVPATAPVSCAVDPASGDLAVTAAGEYHTGEGASLLVYRKAKGRPQPYTYSKILAYTYCVYDGSGNLFVDGTPAHGYGYDFELSELPYGATSLQGVSVQNGMPWSAALQWDGKHLAVGQNILPQILRYTVSAGYARYVSSTPLSGAYNAIDFTLAGRRKAIVINEYYVDRYIVMWDVLAYHYPAGGEIQEVVNFDGPISSVAFSARRR